MIRLKKSDVIKAKAWARQTADLMGHCLSPKWTKWHKMKVGGTIGRVRKNHCVRCGADLYLLPNGGREGLPVHCQCPKDPNRRI